MALMFVFQSEFERTIGEDKRERGGTKAGVAGKVSGGDLVFYCCMCSCLGRMDINR
jgi:hypothetical protein